MMTGNIYIDSLRMHAFHGVLEQEKTVGNDYIVSVTMEYPLENACQTDNLDDTINYANVADTVVEEMKIPSKLVEHVAGRIVRRLKSLFPATTMVRVNVKKVAPPMPTLSTNCKTAVNSLSSHRKMFTLVKWWANTARIKTSW